MFDNHLKELRVKLRITKEQIGAEKLLRQVFFGIGNPTEAIQESSKGGSKPTSRSALVFKRRLERLILQEFNMINLSRVNQALKEAPKPE